MSPWRVETLRLTRTPRLVSLLAVFTFLGLAQPVLARYGEEVVRAMGGGGGAEIHLPPPTVESALTAYLGQTAGLGMLVAAGVTVAACAIDARPSLATYYRTRTASLGGQLAPRAVLSWGATILAFTVGLAAAAYETVVLIGPVPAAGLARCWVAGVAFLSLAVGAAALAGALVRSVLAGFAAVAAAFMVVVPLLGAVPALRPWVPTAAPTQVLTTLAPQPLAVALAGSVVLVVAATLLVGCRPLSR